MALQAIPTLYNGIKFRSRLEARWACFFDECKLKWNYELEGYEYGNYRYLPDFYLPESEVYVEVKPNMDFLKEVKVFEKLVEFMKVSTKKVVVFVDTPVKAKYYSYTGFTDITTGKPSLSELKGVWLLDKNDQYKPLFYEIGLEMPYEFFIAASNKKFGDRF